MDVSTTLIDEVTDLAEAAARRGSTVAFQSTLAAATRAVRRALEQEEQAEAAALSLAQREALHTMTAELRAVAEALCTALDAQGRCLLPSEPEPATLKRRLFRRIRPEPEKPQTASSWWFTLAEAVEALGAGASAMDALAAGQPPEAPSRALSAATGQILREHHDQLITQAERWMG